MQQICKHCERVIREGDEVKALVIANYKELASQSVYAITNPTECVEIMHNNCQYPQGAPEGD